jgi:hypothetical protein
MVRTIHVSSGPESIDALNWLYSLRFRVQGPVGLP